MDLTNGNLANILVINLPPNPTPHWLPHKAQYSHPNEHELVIYGRFGGGPKGFVAIDDIQLWEGSCDEHPAPPPGPTPSLVLPPHPCPRPRFYTHPWPILRPHPRPIRIAGRGRDGPKSRSVSEISY